MPKSVDPAQPAQAGLSEPIGFLESVHPKLGQESAGRILPVTGVNLPITRMRLI